MCTDCAARRYDTRRPAARRRLPKGTRREAGFTLIELLVVVAIIALLISILLPSLSQARDQARASVCASRISQLCRALLLYADDNNETPPFMGRGWEDADDAGQDDLIWPLLPGVTTTVRQWKFFEDWIMPNMPDYWTLTQDEWPEYAKVSNGRLFSYARFDALYRCPGFERVADPRKSQNAFNYTRSLLGRKWFHKNDPEGKEHSPWYSGSWAGAAGPILRVSQVYAPSRLQIIFGERWERHCAAAPDEFSPPAPAGSGMIEGMIYAQWMVADPILCLFGDEIGQYHGAKMSSQIAPEEIRDQIQKVQRENAAFYDGHAALELDPLPGRHVDPEWGFFEAVELATKFIDWGLGHIFSQRGPSDVSVDSPF